MDSIWTKTARLPRFPALHGDLKVDVLVVGGGLAGLLCAYKLDRAGVDYALVEAKTICSGITPNTTAKVTAQHGLAYQKLIRSLGRERAGMYLRANQGAVEELRAMARDIPCDFEERDSYIYSRDGREPLERELRALGELGYPAEYVQSLPLPFPTDGAVCFRDQGQFHPLKFAAGLARGLRIFEHTKIWELGPGLARTDRGFVRAKAMVIATHFPVLNKHGGYFAKLYQERSYVLALEPGPDLHGMYLDQDREGLSWRNYGDTLILGGPSRRTGRDKEGWRRLEELARRWYPKARVTARWANQDCMSLDGSGYMGRYAKGARGLYVATGFNQWGMTSALVAANLLTDQVLGRESPYAPAFDPGRGALHPQLGVNLLKAAADLLTPTTPRCPHMGCALKYNRAEASWDCPCHGSRFSKEGALLDNPSTDDLN